jgi:predicted kinase/ribosomal protein S18 acetylase RimI-like enzyme
MGAQHKAMKLSYRKATTDDVARMFEVRKTSILGLAPNGMSVPQAVDWSSRLTLDAMTQRLNDAEFWVAEINNAIVGWVGIRSDEIYGLYVDPQFVNRGIGSGLLRLAEGIMLATGISKARLHASWNAEAFYVRQGYNPTGPRPSDETRIFEKALTGAARLRQRDNPIIVMLAGLPGTGKTTLAYALARALGLIVLDKDLVNTALISAAINQSIAGPLSYDVLLDLAEDMVAVQRHSVILDTAGRQPIILDRALQITTKASAMLRVIRLAAPREVRLRRMAAREPLPSQWSEDETTDIDEAQWYAHLPPDSLTIFSTRPVEELLPGAVKFLQS